MPVKLKATLSASAGEKPVMIYFLCDVKTSDAAVKEALETVGKAFAEYQATAAGKLSASRLSDIPVNLLVEEFTGVRLSDRRNCRIFVLH